MGKKPKTEIIPEMEPANDAVQPQSSTPRKKRKRAAPINIKIETINPSSDKSLPLIGYFPSGYDPEKRKRAENQPTVTVLKHVKRNNRLQLVVTPSRSSKVDFVGTNYSGEAAAPQICSYALGVLDKETGTLRIVQIESNKIFRLEPRFGDEDNRVDEATKVAEDEEKEEDIQAKYSFSTKKSDRTAKKERALRAYRDPAAQEDLNSKMADAVVNTDALQMGIDATSMARNIPPYDMSATIPQLVYPLEKIIFKGEWRYLLDIAERLQQGGDIKPGLYPLFVCNRIHKLEEVQDEEAKESLACIFSYINHLIKFKDKNSMDGFRSAKDHKFPTILTQKFNDMFGNANAEARRLADDKRDLIISYILVLTLFVDNFKTDITDIAKDLKMRGGDLATHFQFLGCKFVKQNGIKFATLPAPLKFEEPRNRRKR